MTKNEAKTAALSIARCLLEAGLAKSAFPPLNRSEALRFSKAWGRTMPLELREWLGVWNGGLPPGVLPVGRFCGVGQHKRGNSQASVIARVNAYGGWDWPANHFTIADDGCSNFYLLVPAPTGREWWTAFWDRESGHSDPSAINYFVSSSLWHFLVGVFVVGPLGPQANSIDKYPWVQFPDGNGWPFSKAMAKRFDPELGAYRGRLAPWNA